MSTVESPPAIDLPYAPAIDGLVIRHAHARRLGRDGGVAERGARAADGVDEVRTTESLRGRVRAPRDVPARTATCSWRCVDGRMVGLRHGRARRARRRARRRDVGRRPPEAPAPGHRHDALARQPRPPGRRGSRGPAARTPRAARRTRSTRGRRPRADRRRRATSRSGSGSRCGGSSPGRSPSTRSPTGLELRPVRPEDHRTICDADNEAFRDHWGHREQTEGDFVARLHAPETNTALWSRRVGRRRGRRVA